MTTPKVPKQLDAIINIKVTGSELIRKKNAAISVKEVSIMDVVGEDGEMYPVGISSQSALMSIFQALALVLMEISNPKDTKFEQLLMEMADTLVQLRDNKNNYELYRETYKKYFGYKPNISTK